ncbi:MAG: hypothetical protein QXS20_08460 [Candidatus Thorarchaeota archaeon]
MQDNDWIWNRVVLPPLSPTIPDDPFSAPPLSPTIPDDPFSAPPLSPTIPDDPFMAPPEPIDPDQPF